MDKQDPRMFEEESGAISTWVPHVSDPTPPESAETSTMRQLRRQYNEYVWRGGKESFEQWLERIARQAATDADKRLKAHGY